MLPTLLTVFLFAFSAICGRRITDRMDSLWANLIRLCGAAAVLAVLALSLSPTSVPRPVLLWFLLSGAVGFGVGDIGLFLAYARIGSRLTVLIYLCLAPFFAAAGEWIGLGETLSGLEMGALMVILGGVALALSGPMPQRDNRSAFAQGLFWAAVAGLGQGLGGVISRLGETAANGLGTSIPAFNQAMLRCLGGLALTALTALVVHRLRSASQRRLWKSGRPAPVPFSLWMVGAMLAGPVLGVTCFQWSLLTVGNSAIVQAIVSTTPIALIPMAWWLENDRPTLRSVAGAIVAVGGVVAICLARGL